MIPTVDANVIQWAVSDNGSTGALHVLGKSSILLRSTNSLSVCNVSQVRRPSLEVVGRRFESCHADQVSGVGSSMVEPWIVIPVVASSNLVLHPKQYLSGVMAASRIPNPLGQGSNPWGDASFKWC